MKRGWAAPQARQAQGPDGQIRSIDEERAINEMISVCLSDQAGEGFVRYLRDLTINTALKPPFTDLELAHREGARWVVAVIMQRLELGRRKLPADPAPERVEMRRE